MHVVTLRWPVARVSVHNEWLQNAADDADDEQRFSMKYATKPTSESCRPHMGLVSNSQLLKYKFKCRKFGSEWQRIAKNYKK
jgi:hypothetical protein